MQRRWLFISLMALLTAVGMVVMVVGSSDKKSSWNDPVKQWETIKFSHKKHIGEVGAECNMCHPTANTSENSNDMMMPTHEECGTCHSTEIQETCQYCHTEVDKYEAFAAPEREVRFSHKQHVEANKMECSVCHAGIENSEKPSAAFLPLMETCNACHNDVQVTNACESCHKRPENLLPLSHEILGWKKEHKRYVRLQGLSNDCAVCHTDNFCQACHAEVTTQFTRGEPNRSVAENRLSPENRQPLVKPRVHDLNFVFSHAIDMRAKQSDCQSCHNSQTFCVDCHELNQDAGFPSPFPASHSAVDFVRLGMGSGGGQHAVLARRDMESCVSCHDVEGRDPVCVQCHVDLAPKGIKQ